jgi:serine/threonine protein kinase
MAAGIALEMWRQQAPISHMDEASAPRLLSRYGVGSVLCGKYRLDALIGEGAMGAVWQATNLLLDARVAIKLTHADLEGAFRERLQLEARAAAGLVHPAIVRVFDVAETELGDPFIVMELLQGNTLAQLLMRGRLPAARAVQVILPIVDALSTMHARGVVHRDLKPDNLLVSFEDERVQPKVLDFGIAKRNAPRAQDGFIDESGTLIGSPEYMSPEQAAANDEVDGATDIWSICVVLYESLAGETPFRAHTAECLLRAIIQDERRSPKWASQTNACGNHSHRSFQGTARTAKIDVRTRTGACCLADQKRRTKTSGRPRVEMVETRARRRGTRSVPRGSRYSARRQRRARVLCRRAEAEPDDDGYRDVGRAER